MIALLQEDFVQTALLAGLTVALVAGAVGTFVVLRQMTFAVHAVSELGFTGAAAALAVGASPVAGLLVGGVVVAVVLGRLTASGRERDSSIGTVLAFGLGVGVLLLSLYPGFANQATGLLFGSILGVSRSQLLVLAVLAALVLVVLALVARPLLFATVDAEVAAARGVPVPVMSTVLLLLLAVTAAEAVQVVGVLLVLTLVVTPAAAAVRTARSPAGAVAMAMLLAVVAAVGGILLSLQFSLPASFFVATTSFTFWLLARLAAPWWEGRAARSADRARSVRAPLTAGPAADPR